MHPWKPSPTYRRAPAGQPGGFLLRGPAPPRGSWESIGGGDDWDLVPFFHKDPDTADIADNVARYVGRSPVFIEKQLIELAETGVLGRETLGEMAIYSLATDREMRDLIGQFMLARDDRRFRVKVLYHIIRNMSG